MKLHGEATKALGDPVLKKKMVDLGLGMPAGSPEQFARFISEDTAIAAKVIKTAKVQAE